MGTVVADWRSDREILHSKQPSPDEILAGQCKRKSQPNHQIQNGGVVHRSLRDWVKIKIDHNVHKAES